MKSNFTMGMFSQDGYNAGSHENHSMDCYVYYLVCPAVILTSKQLHRPQKRSCLRINSFCRIFMYSHLGTAQLHVYTAKLSMLSMVRFSLPMHVFPCVAYAYFVLPDKHSWCLKLIPYSIFKNLFC